MKKVTKKGKVKTKLKSIEEIKSLKNPIQYIKKYIKDIPLEERAEEIHKIGTKIANVQIITQDYYSVVKESNKSNLKLGTQIMELALDLPNCPDELCNKLGVIYSFKKKWKEAINVFGKAVEQRPFDPKYTPMYITGIFMAAFPLGKQDIIDKYIDICLKNDKILNNPYSLSNVIYALNRKETKEASDIALKLTKDYWNKKDREIIPTLYVNMTDTYIVADLIDDTLEEIMNEVFDKLDKLHPVIFENIAWYYLKKDEPDNAIYYLKQAKRTGHPGFQGLKTSKYFKKLWKNPDFQRLFD
ncbi:MAG: hypothetical protein ACFFDN_16615 [Candidatus Hodarchaeota archaeon]